MLYRAEINVGQGFVRFKLKHTVEVSFLYDEYNLFIFITDEQTDWLNSLEKNNLGYPVMTELSLLCHAPVLKQ